MHQLSERLADDDGTVVRRFDDGDRRGVAVDFGPEMMDASLDVVDGTAILVGGEHYEFDLPPGSQAFMKNGVLTVEVQE